MESFFYIMRSTLCVFEVLACCIMLCLNRTRTKGGKILLQGGSTMIEKLYTLVGKTLIKKRDRKLLEKSAEILINNDLYDGYFVSCLAKLAPKRSVDKGIYTIRLGPGIQVKVKESEVLK